MKTILVVEDNAVESRILKLGLEKDNFKVLVASNGFYAIDLLSDNKVDLVLTDLMMSQMNGFRLIRILRTNQDFRNIPIIVCSSMTDKTDVQKAIKLGANDYIIKPFDLNTILKKINNLLTIEGNKSSIEREDFKRTIGPVELKFQCVVLAFSEQGLRLLSPIPLPVNQVYELESSIFSSLPKMDQMSFEVFACRKLDQKYEITLQCCVMTPDQLINAWIPPVAYKEGMDSTLSKCSIKLQGGILELSESNLTAVLSIPSSIGTNFSISSPIFDEIGLENFEKSYEVKDATFQRWQHFISLKPLDLNVTEQQKLASWAKKTDIQKIAS